MSEQTTVTQGKGCARWFVRDGRLRSGWRVLLYLISARLVQLVAALVFGLAIAVILAGVWMNQGLTPEQLSRRLAAELANVGGPSPLGFGFRVWDTLSVLAVIWLFRRLLDKRSFASLGFQLSPGWWRDALAGFAVAVAMWLAVFALSLGLGAATVVGFAWDYQNALTLLGALVVGLLFNVFVGITEEADARGYMLQNLAEGIRFAPAVVVSSVYFGALHLLNPGAGLGSTIGIFFAGVLLAMGYYATGRLWFSIGMHAAWNFAEGPLFGFLVSGLDMGGLFRLDVTGPEWLMGGRFGPEAGALAVGVELVAIMALWGWASRRRMTNDK